MNEVFESYKIWPDLLLIKNFYKFSEIENIINNTKAMNMIYFLSRIIS